MKKRFRTSFITYFRFIKLVYKKNKVFVILKVFLSVLSGVLSVVTAIIPKYMADAIIIEQSRNSFIIYVLLYILLQLLVMGVYKFVELFINKTSIVLNAQCTEEVLEKLHKMIYENYEIPESRSCIDRAFNFATKTGVGSFNTFVTLLGTLITFISYIYIIAKNNWVTLCFLTVSIVATYILQKRKTEYEHLLRRELTTDERRIDYYKLAMLDKTIARDINYANQFGLLKKNYKYEVDKYSQRLYNKSKKIYFYEQFMSVLQLTLVFIIMISFGFKLLNNSITYGDYTVSVNVSMSFTGLVFRLIGNITSIYAAILDSENYGEFIKLSSKRSVRLHSQNPQIKFENVSFKYGTEHHYALENFSYTFEFGKKYAIVGENGSGKSTILKLMLGLYVPLNGRVTICDIDIKEIDYEDLYSMYAVVFQDFRLLDGLSLKENLVSGSSHIDDEKLYALLESIGLYDKLCNDEKEALLREHSRTFDDNGIELSGGEKQKMAIARALLKKSPILILDEPTSAFDATSQSNFFDSVLSECNMTVIYVTHNNAFASLADEILTIKKGKLIDVKNNSN